MLESFAYLNSKSTFVSFVSTFPLLLQRVSLSLSPVSSFLLFFSDLIFPAVLDPSYFSLKRLFVGVCRAAESEGRVLDLGVLVPSASVLRRLSEEFFVLATSELGARESVRALMASPGGSWSLVRSEDLPKGLSDGDDGNRSSEGTPSVSGSSRVGDS